MTLKEKLFMRYRKMLSSFLMLLALAIVMGACGQGSAQAGSSAPVALGTSNAVQPSRQVTTPEPTPDLGTGSHARPLKISACLDEIAQNFGTWYVSIAGTKKVIEWNFNMEVAHLIHPGIYVQLF